MNIPILLLDMDGVMNGHERWPNGYCGIRYDCVENLNIILAAHPDMKIVISSAWRYMILGLDVSIKGFEYILLVAGVNAYGRVWGHTCSDEAIPSRAEQIKQYIIKHDVKQYVVLDDMSDEDLAGEIPNLIRTDPKEGLTREKAAEVIAAFKQQGVMVIR
jgi:hypothetical protein